MSQKWYHKATVQGAFVAGGFALAIAIINVVFNMGNPKQINSRNTSLPPGASVDSSSDLSDGDKGDLLLVVVESKHSGEVCSLRVSKRASIEWLVERARKCYNLTNEAQVGALNPFQVRWVLVDKTVEHLWLDMNRSDQQRLWAIIGPRTHHKLCFSKFDRLEQLDIYSGIVFYLYAIEDITHRANVGNTTMRQFSDEGVKPPARPVERSIEQMARMVFINGGSFEYDDFLNDDSSENVHIVQIRDFYMSAKEINNEEYCEFLNAHAGQDTLVKTWIEINNDYTLILDYNGRYIPRQNYELHPVVMVSWEGAAAYCDWLSLKRNETFRLPTEAEWEYAARAGGKNIKYPWGSDAPGPAQANFIDSGIQNTVPADFYPPNEIGLYNMAGNVFEWCMDWYEEDSYRFSSEHNPHGTHNEIFRVLRGGAWNSPGHELLCTFRSFAEPNARRWNTGFRIVHSKFDERPFDR